MSNSCRKIKGGLSAVCCSNGRTQYIRGITQNTQAALPYIYIYIQIIDFHMSQYIMQTACPVLVHKLVQYDIHTICDVKIFVVHLTH